MVTKLLEEEDIMAYLLTFEWLMAVVVDVNCNLLLLKVL